MDIKRLQCLATQKPFVRLSSDTGNTSSTDTECKSEARRILTPEAIKLLVRKNITIVPAMKRIMYTTAVEEEFGRVREEKRNASDCNWMFYLNIPEVAPETFPKDMLSKTPIKEDRRKLMTLEELEKLYAPDRKKRECAPYLKN